MKDRESEKDARDFEEHQRQEYNVFQVARHLTVSPRTVCKWIDAGKLRGRRDEESGERFVTHADLVDFCVLYKMPLPPPSGV
jgi:hypothetical protein